MLLAGAGTGKTRTVTCRIAHMLEKRIDPSEILAVTFTNKAASEMRERISGMVSKKAAEDFMQNPRSSVFCSTHTRSH
jgi:superfamily I DNA/RNA helicase